MSLVRLVGEYRAQLRADFRQYYGCSFDTILKESVIETADLAVMLPSGSRTMASISPEYAWGQDTYLLAEIANSLRTLVWFNSEDGQKKRNRPKPILPPGMEANERDTVSLDIDEYKRILSMPRKEVEHGN